MSQRKHQPIRSIVTVTPRQQEIINRLHALAALRLQSMKGR